MCVQFELNDTHVKGHVSIVTLYAIMFKGHVSSCSEWPLGG